jgi:hypothetical protein
MVDDASRLRVVNKLPGVVEDPRAAHLAHAALRTDRGTSFLLWNKPFTIISGAIHYFRVPEDYWEDRLRKLRYLGANTVETCKTKKTTLGLLGSVSSSHRT